MPKLYSDIKAGYVKKGVDYDKAQEIAARTYYRLTGRTVNQDAKSAHEPSRGGRSAAKRREMQ